MMRNPIDQIPYPEQYVEFFELFNQREYYESHEVLEDLWIMETGTEKNYFKGMIMVTIALEHWKRGNLQSAFRLWRDGDKLLAPYQSPVMGFDLKSFRNTLQKLMKEIIQSEGKRSSPCDLSIHPILHLEQTAE